MKAAFTWLALLGMGAMALGETTDGTGVLRWRDGESLSGQIVSATDTVLTWRSPLFEDALTLRWDALRRADWPVKPAAAIEPFVVLLRDGSSLFADLVAVNDDSIVVRSARHGQTALKRSEVVSVQRIRGEHIAAAGPAGDARWRPAAAEGRDLPTPAGAVPQLRPDPTGGLALPYWNRSAWMEVPFPAMAECDFRLSSTRTPDFRLSFAAGGNMRLVVETWDEDIVLRAGDDFHVIGHVGEADREIAFRLLWDTVNRKCLVFSPTGEPLTEWTVPADTNSSSPRLILQNKGRDLVLEHFRLRRWSGQPLTKVRGDSPRLELSDGRMLEGKITAGPNGSVAVQTASEATPTEHPLASIDALIFSAPARVEASRQTTITFADGTVILGALQKIDGDRAQIATSFAAEPVTAQLAGLVQLRQSAEAPPTAADATEPAGDTLILPGYTMRGRMVATGDAAPRWLPKGGTSPALPLRTLSLEMRRALAPDATPAESAALIYTRAGDVLSGTLTGFSRDAVEFNSDFTGPAKLPAESVDAVQFRAVGAKSVEGFADPEWKLISTPDNKEVPKSPRTNSVKLNPGAAIFHPSVLHCPEVRFSIGGDGYRTLRVRLFTGGLEAGKATSLLIASMGGRVYWGVEVTEGQLQNQQQIVAPSGKPLPVALIINEKGFELHLNGAQHGWYAMPLSRRAGAGLRLECASLWGNDPTPLTLSDFTARSAPGRAWLPDVNAEARTHALTIPRFREDRPPRHALLAFNGDVLRGEIEAMNATHFAFRSGLEVLRVPRERVCAAINLKPAAANATPAVEASEAEKVLDRTISRHIQFNAEMRSILATLQSEMGGFTFKYPSERDPRRMFIDFGGRTVREVLDDLCSFYGLRYRAEGSAIIVEKQQSMPAGILTRVYWLKANAFPAGADVKKMLGEKGVPLPELAQATWEPAGSQLSLTTTAALHEQVAKVLAAEFGPLADPPSHWLQLASGARIGFAATKFAPDFVHGRHPVHGECRVPLALVHTIRTDPPEATPAMKALANWQLIRAPEPVLPQSGGESSPALGKIAETFTLPLLGGGDFDLAREKGKVVVLDFWATWCGPCIKAMPGMIEAMSALPADRVRFIAVNQGEPAEQVSRFIQTRDWKLTVAMDGGQSVARKYGVEGIPHTVVIGPDGKIAWVKTGFSPTAASEAAEAVKRLLEKSSAGN